MSRRCTDWPASELIEDDMIWANHHCSRREPHHVVLGIAIGLMLSPLANTVEHNQVSIWLEVVHRVTTSIGGLGTFVALIIVLRQFHLLRTQSELVQKNIVASMDAQLYVRLDSFNRFVFEHSKEYDLLDTPYLKVESPEQRSKLHRMCELGFTSIAFPLIGAGSGGFNEERAKALILDELGKLDAPMTVKVVVFKKAKR
jgi:hypothetical protein